MKKLMALCIVTGVLACSVLPVQAATCPPHYFYNPTNVSGYVANTTTHDHVTGYYDATTPIYEKCVVKETHKIYQYSCAQCGALDSTGKQWEEVVYDHSVK